jgi:MerR family redox-sensitive transcriptional activator SoxR
MSQFLISEVARQAGIQPSAIRYYEQIGLLPRAERTSGQRRYDSTALYRLAVIQRARQLGFTLEEIRQLFFGFRNVARASERWHTLSQKKLAEMDELMDGIKAMRRLLERMMKNCKCATLEQCGKAIFQRGCADIVVKSPTLRHRRS